MQPLSRAATTIRVVHVYVEKTKSEKNKLKGWEGKKKRVKLLLFMQGRSGRPLLDRNASSCRMHFSF